MATKKWMGTKPEKCDLCRHKLHDVFYDARLRNIGTWAILDQKCFDMMGSGLGTGLGQKRVLEMPSLNSLLPTSLK